MTQFILKNKKAIIGVAAILLIGGITMSFQDSPFSYSKHTVFENDYLPECPNDTVPEQEFSGSMKMKDFDKLQSQLDKSLLQVDEQLRNIDLTRIQKEIASSLKSVDMEKIMKDVERSLKDIDMDKIMATVNSSLKDIKLDYKQEEVEKALQEARKEIEKAKLDMKDVDKEEIRKELENAKKEIEKSKLEIDKLDMPAWRRDRDKIMSGARAGIDEAKEELKLTKELFTGLEKDGLIDPKEGFTLEYKDKDLYIDGKKQSTKTTDKYRKYFKKDHFKITIEKE